MAASIYRSAAVSTATYGTPEISGLILAGADLNSFSDSIGSERWTTTADLSLAVIEI